MVYIEMENSIKVHNVQGILLQETFDNQADLSVYPQGLYFLQVNDTWVKVIKK